MTHTGKGLIAVLGVAWALGGASPALAQSMEAELTGLLGSHPRIKASESTYQAAGEGVSQAWAPFMPQVAVSADAGMEHVNNPTRRTVNEAAYNRGRESTNLTVTQNLYNGGADSAALDAARTQEQIAAIDLEVARQEVLLEGITAYLAVVRQTQLVRYARRNEDTIRRQLNLEDERVKRGSGIAVDVLQAKSRLQVSKERRVAFEGALEDSVSTYLQVFDHMPDRKAMMLPDPPLHALPASLEEAIDTAIAENPSMHSSRASILLADYNRDAAVSGYLPSVDLEFQHNYENDVDTVIGVRRDWSLLLKAQWQIFDGLATRAAVAGAAYQHAAAQDNAVYTRRKVVEQVRLMWQAYKTSTERVELLQNAVAIAQEVFANREKLREAGKETLINVLDSENEIYNAQINLAAARNDRRLAAFQLLFTMGRLKMDTVLQAAQPASQPQPQADEPEAAQAVSG